MDSILNWKEWVTLGVALLGAALGIMNTWRAIAVGRVRLRVRPAHVISVPQGKSLFSIEVVNLSTFAVTITEVGFTQNGNSINKPRAAIPSPLLIDGGSWPRRLEPRTSVSAYFDPIQIRGSSRDIGRAYARTACGEVGYGSSEALVQLRELAKSWT